MAKLAEKKEGVSVYKMKDGDVASVITWHDSLLEHGDIILRYNSVCIVVGLESGQSYPTFFNSEKLDNRVNILPKGTLIEL